MDRYADPGPPGPPGSDDDDAAHTAARTPLPFTTLDAAATLLRLHVRDEATTHTHTHELKRGAIDHLLTNPP